MTAIATGTAAAQDPVVVDPDHYKVVFENEQVRVLRISYGPQEASVMHEHPAGVAVYLTDLRGQFTMPDGESVEMGGNAGEAVWTEAGSHLPKNLTDEPFELILVELKAPPSAED
ncbi:MAG TPA: cytoplasmic protein [Gemmatimonadota bacterium]|jgi:quercetin dioxygenase-like cupin family protein